MIELQLRDGRILHFQEGEQTHRPGAGSLKEQDIGAVAADGLSVSERHSRGPDFLLSEPGNPNRRLAVELKRGSGREQTKSSRDQLAIHAEKLFKQFGKRTPLQLWVLSSDASSINVSNYTVEQGLENPTIYHLTDVSTRATEMHDAADRFFASKGQIDTKHVIARLDDWEQRIEALYQMVNEWCANISDIQVDQHLTIDIKEEMMRRYAVPARIVPLLRLMREKAALLTFKPYGLWIIGANGRLDVLAANASYFLIDVAEQFEPPIWKLFGSGEKRIQNQRLASGVDFTPEVLGALLRG